MKKTEWVDPAHTPDPDREFRMEWQGEWVAPVGTDVPNTPSNERLMQLAKASPPPPEWFEGPEEDLFRIMP